MRDRAKVFAEIGGEILFIGGIVMWIIDAKFGWSRNKQRGFDIVTATIADQGKLNAPDSMSVSTNTHYRTNNMEEMTLVQACWIGACQILSAVFPGTSVMTYCSSVPKNTNPVPFSVA